MLSWVLKRWKKKMVEYPGKSGEFSPFHLHDYFHSVRGRDSQRADFISPTSAPNWLRRRGVVRPRERVNKPSFKKPRECVCVCVYLCEAERVAQRLIYIQAPRPISGFVVVPPPPARIQTRGREIPRSTRPRFTLLPGSSAQGKCWHAVMEGGFRSFAGVKVEVL